MGIESWNMSTQVAPARRLAYAFVGLLAGDAILLCYLLQSAFWIRRSLLAAHIGEPGRMIPVALEEFVIFAACSLVGWLFIGIPTALLFPARSITGLSWASRLLVGAALGPFGLFLIIVLLARGHIDFWASFAGTGTLWIYSVMVSTVSFFVYAALLHRQQVCLSKDWTDGHS